MRRALLLSLTLAFATVAGASDVLVLLSSSAGRPGEGVRLGASVSSRVPDVPVSVRLVITFDPVLAIEHDQSSPLAAGCTETPGRIECTKSDVGYQSLSVPFIVRLPAEPAVREYVFNATVTTTPPDTTPDDNTARSTIQVIGQHLVSNTNDTGPGSLRAAIEAANDWCTQERPCEIRWDLPQGPIAVIDLLSPLPPLTACGVKVGDPPPFDGSRPPIRIEINGRHLSSGHGLELRSACEFPFLELTGIRVIGFPGDGVTVTAVNVYRLRGFEILRNGGRGLAVTARAPRIDVFHSLIAENTRSGIAMLESSLSVLSSNIGIGWDGEDRANGASGIFIAPGAGGLQLRRTTIANHPHYGLALAGRGNVDIDTATVITRNISDVDWFLDGPSSSYTNRPEIPKTPRIVSATYDPATSTTRVTVSLQEARRPLAQVRFYVSDRITIFGTAHLDQFVGVATPASETFTFAIPGSVDLRGKYVSAVTAGYFSSGFPDSPPPEMREMSEVSAAARVE